MDDSGDDYSWNKMVRNAKKVGFRDGIEDGKSSNFQKGFDEGYENGFKNGFELGKLKGFMRVEHNQTEAHADLEKTRRGNCKVCTDETLLDKTISEIKDVQNKSTKEVIQKVYSTLNENYNCSSFN